MTIKEQAAKMKLDSSKMSATTLENRNNALKAIADALTANKEYIIKANEADLLKAEEDGLTAPVLKRLKFNEDKINDVVKGIKDLIGLPDPLGDRKSVV